MYCDGNRGDPNPNQYASYRQSKTACAVCSQWNLAEAGPNQYGPAKLKQACAFSFFERHCNCALNLQTYWQLKGGPANPQEKKAGPVGYMGS